MKICIISPRHVSYNPRVVKEADALDEAGHHVTVIAIRSHSHQTFLDEELMSSRSWRLLTFNYRKQNREWLQWLVSGVRQKFFYFLIYLLLPLMFLPLIFWKNGIMAMPAIGINLISGVPQMYSSHYHYDDICLRFRIIRLYKLAFSKKSQSHAIKNNS